MRTTRTIQRMMILTVMVSAILLLAGCVSGGGSGASARPDRTPEWVNDKDSAYPPEKYLAEVGEGDNLNGAKSNAAGAIAQIFKTRVQVDSTIRTRYTELTGTQGNTLGIATQTDFDQTIGQTADQSLSNLRFGESWTDSMGRVYVVAYLDRAETGNLYRQRIVDNDGRVSQLLSRAGEQTEPLRRYAFLDAAYVFAEANRSLLEQLEIINMPMARSVIHPYDLGQVRSARADQGSALKIRIEVSGNPDGRIAAVLSDWVTSKGFSVAPRGDMFFTAVVALAPVKLNNSYENLSWEMNLNLIDSLGYPAVALAKSGRSSGVSASAAEAVAYKDMSTVVTRDFDRDFNTYLASFLEK